MILLISFLNKFEKNHVLFCDLFIVCIQKRYSESKLSYRRRNKLKSVREAQTEFSRY